VAGWLPPAEIEPPLGPGGQRDFRDLISDLNSPLDAVGRHGAKDSVWHCVLSAAPDDPLLSDEQWNHIAEEFMDQMGLAPRDDPDGVRWAAVRHGLSKDGIDHVHIVATLARQDGRAPNVYRDFVRARKACQAIEKRFGLRATAAADATAVPRPTRAEHEQAQRNRRSEPDRVTLRRIVQDAAATAVSEQDFFARIRDSGAGIRMRNAADQPGTATGYAVALPAGPAGGGRKTIWFGGGKLAPDLTLPKLRRRWDHATGTGRAAPATASAGQGMDARSARAFLRSAARSAAEQARNEAGFFRLLDDAGILVKYRYSELNPGEVTGYSLTLPGHADENGGLQWYGGGRLADNLTMPKLRRRWDAGGKDGPIPVGLSPSERHAIWNDFIRITGEGAAEMQRLAPGDPAAASDIAWATADALRATARTIGGSPGRQIGRAADDFDRAARMTYRTIPRQTPTGSRLRTASRMLSVLRPGGGPVIRLDRLIASLIALVEEVARLRETQRQAHQAEAARAAEGHLRVAHRDEEQRLARLETARRESAARTAAASGARPAAARVAGLDVPAAHSRTQPGGNAPHPAMEPPRAPMPHRRNPGGPGL
jgi:hypothetical protein